MLRVDGAHYVAIRPSDPPAVRIRHRPGAFHTPVAAHASRTPHPKARHPHAPAARDLSLLGPDQAHQAHLQSAPVRESV